MLALGKPDDDHRFSQAHRFQRDVRAGTRCSSQAGMEEMTSVTSQVAEWLSKLRDEQFEEICEQLLQRRGWTVTRPSRKFGPDHGYDFLGQDAQGHRGVVEAKAGRSSLRADALYRLTAQQRLHEAERAILVTTQRISPQLAQEAHALKVEIWDERALTEMIEADIQLRDLLQRLGTGPRLPRPGELRVEKLHVRGYRGVDEAEVTFSSGEVSVLAGVNGAGKTTVLDALATALSWFLARLANPDGRGRPIPERDIHNRARHCVITVQTSIDGRPIRWTVASSRKGAQERPRAELDELNEATRTIQAGLDQEKDRSLPVAVMYAVNRAVLDIPQRIRKRHEFDRFSAHQGALVHGGTRDFRGFFEWFRDREDLENERRIQHPEYRDPQLVAVRQAIETHLDGVSNLRVRRNPQRMIVDKQGEQLVVDQLSDGEKCLLATVGDLARRLALANPASAMPLSEHGVVLIDEIDLHLHPRWQRMVIPTLERTFPNSQFIVTTHSPQVLSHVRSETIRLGRGEHGLAVLDRRSVFGWDTNRILEEFLEVDERPREIKDGLDDYFRLIQSGKLEEAEQARRELEAEIGLDEPSFKKADVLMRHRRLLAGE